MVMMWLCCESACMLLNEELIVRYNDCLLCLNGMIAFFNIVFFSTASPRLISSTHHMSVPLINLSHKHNRNRPCSFSPNLQFWRRRQLAVVAVILTCGVTTDCSIETTLEWAAKRVSTTEVTVCVDFLLCAYNKLVLCLSLFLLKCTVQLVN